ncbi:MAG: ribonuclease J [Deltaproteobacteria bacterium]|nr:ribonuclease J [Deltaproteobacteria bacterium]
MVKLVPLGGLGEIGLNMMAIECEEYILVVDAGIMFPDAFMPGVDVVIPDFSYLLEKKNKVRSVILTHGHEDHLGAMPFFLKSFSVPVYGTNFTLKILAEKLKEHRLLDQADLRTILPGETTSLGPFRVEYLRVNHSIIDGVGLAIETPEGIIIHSGDFKIDTTPVDNQFTDLNRFAYYGEKGVLAFFSDSTNAEKEGFTLSEKDVRETLEGFFRNCRGKIIVAVFASNITRIRQLVELAVASGRKVVFNGKSMITNIAIAKQEGYISIPEDTEINERQADQYQDPGVAVITTGSQGEPMSALTRMARNKHKKLRVNRGDTVILSSRFIPGNERAITDSINRLYRLGADVVYEKVSDIHTSGHAKREELKIMLDLVKPQFFIPIHGEYRHLVKHAQLARAMGIPEEHIILGENGTAIRLEKNEVRLGESVHSGRVMVDGKGVGDVGEIVLRDRRRLSGHGMVIVLLALDEQTGETVYGPDVISRGFVFEGQVGALLEDAKCVILEVLDELERPSPPIWSDLESDIERRLKRFFFKVLERSPLILPLVIPL